MAGVYILAQCLGAFMAYGLLLLFTPFTILKSSGESFCVTKPHELVSSPQAVGVEFIATGILIW